MSSITGVQIKLAGLGALGVALLGLALASEHLGDNIIYTFCLWSGTFCVLMSIMTGLYAWAVNISKKD